MKLGAKLRAAVVQNKLSLRILDASRSLTRSYINEQLELAGFSTWACDVHGPARIEVGAMRHIRYNKRTQTRAHHFVGYDYRRPGTTRALNGQRYDMEA